MEAPISVHFVNPDMMDLESPVMEHLRTKAEPLSTANSKLGRQYGGGSKNGGHPIWMVDFRENPIQMDDLR